MSGNGVLRRSEPEAVSAADRIWFALVLLLSAAWIVTSSGEIGATFDETNYLTNGLARWRSGSYARLMSQGTMPLPVEVATLPVYVRERLRGSAFHLQSDQNSQPVDVRDTHMVLGTARLGNLLFWFVLLLHGWLLARWLAGIVAARMAVFWLATEPSLLGHAALATTDLAITAAIVAFLYHYARGLGESGRFRRIWWPAVWMAFAMLCKASAIVFAPLAMIVAANLHYLKTGAYDGLGSLPLWSRLMAWRDVYRSALMDGLKIFAAGLLITVVYVGSDWKPNAWFVREAAAMEPGATRDAAVWLSRNLCIFNNAFDGLFYQVTHNLKGHGVYVLGEQHHRALWYYFPVAAAIKLPGPLLLLPLGLLIVRPKSLANLATLTAAVLLLFSFTYRVQIGIRMVLPFVALWAIGVGVATAQAARDLPAFGHTVRRGLVTLGLGTAVWSLTSVTLAWPHGLSFANRLWGGPQQCYRLLSDSNTDWGQGLPELDRWRKQQGLGQLAVWYWGSDPQIEDDQFQRVRFHSDLQDVEQIAALTRGRYLAASVTLLYGHPPNRFVAQAQALLREQTPAARTMTYLIYRLPLPESSQPQSAPGDAVVADAYRK